MRGAKDVDDYIANAPDCTRPILVKLRRIFQQASPKLQEAIKWGVPCFVYKGPVGGFAAYQKHVSWGLWKGRLLDDPDGLIGRGIIMGGKITKVSEIPPASRIARLIKQVVTLNEAGIKNPKPPDPELPADFAARLSSTLRLRPEGSSPKAAAMKEGDKAAKDAMKHWAAFTPARKWQYVNWINKAKRPQTRAKRIAAAVEWISEGETMK